MTYLFDELIDIFEKHSIMFDKMNKEHKEKYPDRDANIDWEFNFPDAMLTICKEIKSLKNDNDTAQNKEIT